MDFMKRAIQLAKDGVNNNGGPFGAVVVKNGKIVAESYNRVTLSNDPTAHAEVLAIRKACNVLNTFDLSGCDIYSSCEPCPMCLGAIYWAGITKVVYACNRLDAENAGFSDRYIYDEISLDPSERHIRFVRIDNIGGEVVFKKWAELDGRIQY